MMICCEHCDKHEINQRRKCTIPCKDKFNCKEYIQEQEQIKLGKQREREEHRNNYYDFINKKGDKK